MPGEVRGWLRRFFSRSEWIRWILELPSTKCSRETTGLVLIQVDGLARPQFEQALVRRRMPFLRRLIHRGGYKLYSHYSGLPSTTPAVQGEIFYGKRCAVPSFDFHNVETGDYRNMLNLESAVEIEAQLSAGNPGLLEEGSAFCDIYSGGAAETHICAVHLGWGEAVRTTSPLRLAVVLLLNAFIFVRLPALVLLEIIIGLGDLAAGIWRGHEAKLELQWIGLRAIVSIVLRDWATLGAQVDIARGLPIVHLNLLGYDEQSHRRGPHSLYAHWTLKGIDRRIRSIYASALRSPRRRYQVWIYSDHGQEAAQPYQQIHGRTVDAAIGEVLRELDVDLNPEWARAEKRRRSRAEWARLRKPKTSAPANGGESTGPFVTFQGPVGHLYLNDGIGAKLAEEVAEALVHRAHIPMVMMRDGDEKAKVWTDQGRFELPRDGQKLLYRHGAFAETVARDLARLAHHPCAGTFVILGWREEGTSVTFALENGSHAGPGIMEIHGFALLPKQVDVKMQTPEFIRPGELRTAALEIRGMSPRGRQTPSPSNLDAIEGMLV